MGLNHSNQALGTGTGHDQLSNIYGDLSLEGNLTLFPTHLVQTLPHQV